jgi:hypothetical protein
MSGFLDDRECDMAVRAKSIHLVAQAQRGRLRLVGSWGKRPIDDLAIACAAAGAVDKLIQQTVADARRDGCSWTEIGRSLGISKQAAWERFSGES